jgi:hypothetical protein
MAVHPLLIEVDDELRDGAAEITVPAGEFRLLRLLYTPAVWAEPQPWDGTAQVTITQSWKTTGSGVYMRAVGFGSPFEAERTIEPFVGFLPIAGDGWAGSRTSSSCSGACGDDPPAHDSAVLLGSLDAPVTIRIGIQNEWDPDALWERPPIAVRADAATHSAVAGLSVRYVVVAQETRVVLGDMVTEWSAAVDGTPVAHVERTTDASMDFNVTQRGIMAFALWGIDTLGIEKWSYAVEAAGIKAGWDGPWLHAGPYGTLLALAGALQYPVATLQAYAEPGPVHVEAHRLFTGVDEPVGLVWPQFEIVEAGYAGVDLDALFGWRSVRGPTPNGPGGADCFMASIIPHARVCVGDATMLPSPFA